MKIEDMDILAFFFMISSTYKSMYWSDKNSPKLEV